MTFKIFNNPSARAQARQNRSLPSCPVGVWGPSICHMYLTLWIVGRSSGLVGCMQGLEGGDCSDWREGLSSF